MDAGIYVNLFPVELKDRRAEFMVVDRARYPKLRDLRQQLVDQEIRARVCAARDLVYGYGIDQGLLDAFGFRSENVDVASVPELTSRLVLEGYVDSLELAGYTCQWSFGGAIAYQFGTPIVVAQSGVRLFRGFDLRSMFLLDPETNEVVYGIVIDAAFTYRDTASAPISPADIVTKYGPETLRLLRIRQGDLSPRGGINLEVARQRLTELIIPFVSVRHSLVLPCGISAELSQLPIRVALSTEEQRP